jgi:hypothetical protein
MWLEESWAARAALQGQDEPRVAERSPEGVAHVPQSRLLKMMLDAASLPGTCGRVCFGRGVAGVRQDADGVVALLDGDAQARRSPSHKHASFQHAQG